MRVSPSIPCVRAGRMDRGDDSGQGRLGFTRERSFFPSAVYLCGMDQVVWGHRLMRGLGGRGLVARAV